MYREFCSLLKFVSRLRVNVGFESTPESLSRSFRLLPLWGFILGASSAGLGFLLNLINPQIAAVTALAWVFLLSGGTSWGSLIYLVSGSNEEETEVAKASDEKESKAILGIIIGVLLLLIKFAFYSQAFSDYNAFPLLPAGMVFASWGVVWAIFTFPSTGTGKGAAFHGYFRREDFLTASLLSGLMLMIFRDWQIISGALVALFGVVYLCRKWVKAYGGLSWYSYSALMIWGEIFFLAAYFCIKALFLLITFLAL